MGFLADAAAEAAAVMMVDNGVDGRVAKDEAFALNVIVLMTSTDPTWGHQMGGVGQSAIELT
jgi:hypothetical protein